MRTIVRLRYSFVFDFCDAGEGKRGRLFSPSFTYVSLLALTWRGSGGVRTGD